MIQLAHIATGALAGRGRRGVLDALLAGVAAHGAMDLIPHGEVHDDQFEAVTAIGGVLAVAARHGATSPITWGAIGGVLPDLEHVLPRRIRPSTAIFPTHRWSRLHGWEHKPLAIPAWAQATLGGLVIGIVATVVRRQLPDENVPTTRRFGLGSMR
jgi:hypothetical protein